METQAIDVRNIIGVCRFLAKRQAESNIDVVVDNSGFTVDVRVYIRFEETIHARIWYREKSKDPSKVLVTQITEDCSKEVVEFLEEADRRLDGLVEKYYSDKALRRDQIPSSPLRR